MEETENEDAKSYVIRRTRREKGREYTREMSEG